MTLVVDASVGLKWAVSEPDSQIDEEMLVPDFWLSEPCNVCWLQVRKGIWTPDEAREGLALLQAQVPPTPTGDLNLHDLALEIGLAANHPTYDTLYLSFAVAMEARGVVVADGPFVRDMARHLAPALADMLIPLAE